MAIDSEEADTPRYVLTGEDINRYPPVSDIPR